MRYSMLEYLPRAEMSFIDYKTWLGESLRVVNIETRRYYSVYRVTDKTELENRKIMDLKAIGFDPSICDDGTVQSFEVRRQLVASRTPITRQKHEEIQIAIHPSLVPLLTEIQNYILNVDTAPHRRWVELFAVRKALCVDHAHDLNRGSPNVQWYVVPTPQMLPRSLRCLPETNTAHIMHSASFVVPEVRLGTKNMSALSGDLGVNLTKATSLGHFLTSPLEDVHMDDIQKILLSWMLPTQIQLDIIADNTESMAQLAFYSLICKMMFSTSAGCRNIRVGRWTDVMNTSGTT